MARNQKWILEGLLVLTVTVLLNTRPSQAEDCSPTDYCKNGGTCPTGGQTPCDCSESAYVGDTCETEVCTANDACNGGTCDTDATPNVCSCGAYKGKTCLDECEDAGDCGVGGTCETGPPKTCSCADEEKEGPGCTKDKSGASALTSFSLMSLFVVLRGYLL